MAMKNYTIRLDEEEYEKLKKFLSEHGDPEMNISFVLRSYIRDLNSAIPDLKKSQLTLRSHVAFFGTLFKQFVRSAQVEGIMKGTFPIETLKNKDSKGK